MVVETPHAGEKYGDFRAQHMGIYCNWNFIRIEWEYSRN
jgi:hypothetical protein